MADRPDQRHPGDGPGTGPSPARSATLVIIPALNEQDSLPATLRGLRAAQAGLDVVVVDDGSTDATAAVASANGATVLRLPFNLGIGGALQTGFRYAVRNGYRGAVQFDADGQHEPQSISVLLDALDHGADLVIGSRFAHTDHRYEVSRVRAGAMGLLRLWVRQISGQQFTDTSSGFRGFSASMLEYFAEHYPSDYMESVEALLLASAAGFTVTEVPVVMHQRQHGSPSQRRLRLLYHYLRLLLVIAVSTPFRSRSRNGRPLPLAGDSA
jgi:glycosyltransferase involved in cell wall biosynthesis